MICICTVPLAGLGATLLLSESWVAFRKDLGCVGESLAPPAPNPKESYIVYAWCHCLGAMANKLPQSHCQTPALELIDPVWFCGFYLK
eukprot:5134986-Amphidinium_carterae.1